MPFEKVEGRGEGGKRKGEFTVQLLPDLIRYT